LVVYAFSTQEEVLTQSILPAFEAAWEAETGRDLTIEAMFGPSGTLAGQINLGAPADVALFSNEQHVNWLKIGQQVRWETHPVVVSTTPLVIVTRPGNPAGIVEFRDLAQPGLRLLHADPHSSGAGDWAVLAEYGSALRAEPVPELVEGRDEALLESGDQAAAQTQLEAIWHNVRLLAPSARATLTLFELGAGDTLVTYEHDAYLALARGVPLEIVVPPRTTVAHHVAVIVDSNVTPAERPVAQAFVNFLLTIPVRVRSATITCVPWLSKAMLSRRWSIPLPSKIWVAGHIPMPNWWKICGRWKSKRASIWNRTSSCWIREE
jgi:sulfate transport system substrate-binding protein